MSNLHLGGRSVLRRAGLVLAMLGLVAAITPVAGAAPDPCAAVCISSGRAKAATAIFSTEPAVPVPGVVYSDVVLMAARLDEASRGQRAGTTFIDVIVAKYKYDRYGETHFVSYELGEAYGSAVTFSVAHRLARASVSANVRFERCDFGPEDFDCTPQPNASTIRAEWTARGLPIYIDARVSARTRGLKVVDAFRGMRRDAMAAGTINGRSLGSVMNASLADQRSHTIDINHTKAPTIW